MHLSDEYRASQQNIPSWALLLVWVGWVILGMAGYVIGDMLSNMVTSALLGNSSTGRALSIEGDVQIAGVAGYGVALIGGLVAGIVLAVAQCVVLFPFFKKTGTAEWAVATVIGRTIQWLIFYVVGIDMVGITFDKEVASVILMHVILGLAGGLGAAALAYPQSQVLKRRTARSQAWLIINLLGPIITGLIVGISLFIQGENVLRDFTTLLAAALVSISTGFTLLEVLRQPREGAEWEDSLTWRSDEAEQRGEETELGSSLYVRK